MNWSGWPNANTPEAPITLPEIKLPHYRRKGRRVGVGGDLFSQREVKADCIIASAESHPDEISTTAARHANSTLTLFLLISSSLDSIIRWDAA